MRDKHTRWRSQNENSYAIGFYPRNVCIATASTSPRPPLWSAVIAGHDPCKPTVPPSPGRAEYAECGESVFDLSRARALEIVKRFSDHVHLTRAIPITSGHFMRVKRETLVVIIRACNGPARSAHLTASAEERIGSCFRFYGQLTLRKCPNDFTRPIKILDSARITSARRNVSAALSGFFFFSILVRNHEIL